MKKIIFICVIAIGCTTAFAQAGSTISPLPDAKSISNTVKANDSILGKNSGSAAMNEVNTRAVRDFLKRFRNAKDEKWYVTPNGFLAEYASDDSKYVAAYDENGNWKYTICYYSEKSLPREIRSIVKRVYYDYDISWVQEVRIKDKIIYVVNLQAESNWKNVRVYDGEMEVMEDFNKY